MSAILTFYSENKLKNTQVGEEAGIEHLARTEQPDSENQVSAGSGRSISTDMQEGDGGISKHLRRELFKILAGQFLEEIHEICAVDRAGSGEEGSAAAAAAASSQILLPYLTTGISLGYLQIGMLLMALINEIVNLITSGNSLMSCFLKK
jgi:hypothetical protein